MEMDPENIVAAIHQRYGVPERENSAPPFGFPPGFRFNPDDEELIIHFLNRKIKDQPLLYNVFNDVNLYDYDPEELVENFELLGEEKLYFFTPRARKYPNGSRPARAAGGGYWKATGSEKKIYSNQQLVGVKKTLVYYRGKPKEIDDVKTDWTMQEYISEITTCKPGDSMKLDDWVLCCIHKKRGAIANRHKLEKVSQSQSDMPTEQVTNNNQSYQTSIDSNGGYGNAIMAQGLVAASSERMTEFNDMIPSLVVAPSVQITEFNGMAQLLAVAPSVQMTEFNGMVQPLAVEPSVQMTEFNGMVQPSAIAPSGQMIDFNRIVLPFVVEPSEQMIDSYGMVQPLVEAYGEQISNLDSMVQEPTISPTEPMTDFNYMAQPSAAASIEPMIGFNDRTQLSEIADFNAMRQPLPYALVTEHNRITSIRNNHSVRQGFQQNSSNAMTSGKDHVDQFGMTYGERESDEVIYRMKLHYDQLNMEMDNILSDSIKPKDVDAGKHSRCGANDAGSKHAEDFTKPDP